MNFAGFRSEPHRQKKLHHLGLGEKHFILTMKFANNSFATHGQKVMNYFQRHAAKLMTRHYFVISLLSPDRVQRFWPDT